MVENENDDKRTHNYPENRKERVNPRARENQLDFLFELHSQGIPIGDDNLKLLEENGYFTKSFTKAEKEKIVTDNINEGFLAKKSDAAIQADSRIDIVESEQAPQDVLEIITSEELEARRNEYGHIFEGRTNPIERYDWAPKSTTEHEQDFIDWINSINLRGFRNKINYRKFSLYCQQAYTWLSDGLTSHDFDDEDEREEYRLEELRRCDENNLYFLNKYIYYKEGDAEDKTGRIKYVARPPHEVLAYLDDCGYSIILAKGRQQAVTTTLMALDVRDVIFKRNHFMKFITEDDEKAVEIFEDKLKFAFSELEYWMRPNVLNERDNLFKIADKEEKGKKKGVGSKIMVVVPKRTAIAGGAPQKIKIDEAGNIPILGKMIGNARPTMYWSNPKTKKLEIKRKIWIYGTGGELEKGGGAFQNEFMSIYNSWLEGKYHACIVPLFFDKTCRTGYTDEIYEAEKQVAYDKGANPADPNAKQHITEFYQTWPSSLSDVFKTSATTLLDEEYIEKALQRIREAKAHHKFTLHQSGYFEPVYDYGVEMPEGSDTPYKIVGANFIPTQDIDARASCVIFHPPNHQWRDRYFKGTDPIDTDSGLSDFASTVWDKYFKCPVALMAWRTSDYPQAFMQSMLLTLYYGASHHTREIPELIESNRGSAYYQYVKSKGYGKRAVCNFELPDYLQNRSVKNEGIGIDSHGDRTIQLVNIQFNMFKAYGMNFYIDKIFEQAKTFTCKISNTGKEMWGPMNKRYYKDDALWSTTYSYICAELVFTKLMPVDMQHEDKNVKTIFKYQRDKSNKLALVAQRVRA